MLKNLLKRSPLYSFNPGAVLCIAFGFWLICFFSFLQGRYFDSDAISYYEHIKFFVDNLARGVYPLWDPVWNSGAPNEFFLRRFGSFNPFYLFVLVFYKCGIPFTSAYLCFLVSYYFLGIVGFYKLSQKIFADNFISLAAALILLFSSLGTRLFDSYLILTVTPLLWFFYFLISFIQKKTAPFFVGMIWTTMILVTTYIPFYFIIISGTFLLTLLIFYPVKFFQNITGSFSFFRKEKKAACLCLAALCLALAQGAIFFRESKQGGFSLPGRYATSPQQHVIEVGIKTVTDWAILEDVMYSTAYQDLKRFKFAVIYWPVFFYLVLGLGLLTRLDKKLLFLFVWGVGLFLAVFPYAPIYPFLYKHALVFKYFRNLHFFFWFALLPIFVLFVSRQLQNFLKLKTESPQMRRLVYFFIGALHLAILIYFAFRGDTLVSTYLTLIFSFLFFISNYP